MSPTLIAPLGANTLLHPAEPVFADGAADTDAASREKCTAVPPCRHNMWRRMRKAKARGAVLLRCISCEALWLTTMSMHEKCPAFYAGTCALGADCPRPHVHAREMVRRMEKCPTTLQAESLARNTSLHQLTKKKKLKGKRAGGESTAAAAAALASQNHEGSSCADTSVSRGSSLTTLSGHSTQSSTGVVTTPSHAHHAAATPPPPLVFRFDPYSLDPLVICS